MLQKGVHIKINGVELSVLPGYGGHIVFKSAFGVAYTAKQVDAAKKVAIEALSDPQLIKRLYGAAQRALILAQQSGDPKLIAKAGEFAFLVKALRKLGAQ